MTKSSAAQASSVRCGASASSATLKPPIPASSAFQLALAERGREERSGQRAEPEAGGEDAEPLRRRQSSVSEARTGTSTWKLKPTVLTTVVISSTVRTRGERRAYARPSRTPRKRVGCSARLASTAKSSRSRMSSRLASTARKLTALSAKHDADAGGRDQRGPADGGADDARRVEQARVERDRVRQLVAPDHLIGERVPAGRVEDERGAAERGEHVRMPDLGHAREGERGECDRDEHRRGLRHDHEAADVEAVGDHAGEEAEDGERGEAAEREHADGHRRVVSSTTNHASAMFCIHVPTSETSWPRRRAGSCGGARRLAKTRSVIRSRPAARRAARSRRRARRAVLRRACSAARRATRCGASGRSAARARRPPSRLRPCRRRSPAWAARSTRPARSSRLTCPDMPAGEMRSSVASPRTPIPGLRLISQSSEAWPPVTPSACVSRRSSRLSFSSTGRSRLATSTAVGGASSSLTTLTTLPAGT